MRTNTSFSRRHATITGLFFIAATVTAIIGLALYQPVLSAADPLSEAASRTSDIALGAFFEALLAIANIGTAVMFLPVLRSISRTLGPAYTVFRSLEVVLILTGMVSMLALATTAQQAAGTADAGPYKAIATMLIALHDWTFVMGPHFMLGINTLIYSYLFHRSGMLPRPLAVYGMISAALILIAASLEIFGAITSYDPTIFALAIPIAVFEMVLAGRLIAKGFTQAAEREEVDVAYA